MKNNQKGGLKITKTKKILFKGTIQGTVSSFFPHVGYFLGNWAYNNYISFMIKLDKVIEGNPIKIPEEFPVLGQKYVDREYLLNTHVRNKDIIYVTGKII